MLSHFRILRLLSRIALPGIALMELKCRQPLAVTSNIAYAQPVRIVLSAELRQYVSDNHLRSRKLLLPQGRCSPSPKPVGMAPTAGLGLQTDLLQKCFSIRKIRSLSLCLEPSLTCLKLRRSATLRSSLTWFALTNLLLYLEASLACSRLRGIAALRSTPNMASKKYA